MPFWDQKLNTTTWKQPKRRKTCGCGRVRSGNGAGMMDGHAALRFLKTLGFAWELICTWEYNKDGNLIWPLLLYNVRPDMRIAWEEPFGPGCVFTKDVNKAILISDAMETETVQINSAPAHGPDHFPFQGLKDSGIGSHGVTNSINMMTKIKSTVINLPTPSYTMGKSDDKTKNHQMVAALTLLVAPLQIPIGDMMIFSHGHYRGIFASAICRS
ncbi:hypothetical protein F3Y22_tig00117048pilonHSYRG00824 [Hibiscus syriacus]|uniref:NADP-dependent glyceraldehyde-3-phosphate dehydrogenase n=1 Tax=Hibiscus syriacus TaxID=106335 RepID=A0A6A2W9J1_HIBSY|nr:hypothetical protein F3Y22_tig00117048pilonHSYRG00824 [Hibiscus syriacus]